MPQKEVRNGGKTEFIRTLDGRRAQEHRYDDMSDEEAYASIDARRNVAEPTQVSPGGSVDEAGFHDEAN